MFNFFKTRKSAMYEVTYKFEDEDMVYITTATSAGLASLDADWAIEIIKVVKL